MPDPEQIARDFKRVEQQLREMFPGSSNWTIGVDMAHGESWSPETYHPFEDTQALRDELEQFAWPSRKEADSTAAYMQRYADAIMQQFGWQYLTEMAATLTPTARRIAEDGALYALYTAEGFSPELANLGIRLYRLLKHGESPSQAPEDPSYPTAPEIERQQLVRAGEQHLKELGLVQLDYSFWEMRAPGLIEALAEIPKYCSPAYLKGVSLEELPRFLANLKRLHGEEE